MDHQLPELVVAINYRGDRRMVDLHVDDVDDDVDEH
jgi:hypothetical protein